MNAPTRTIPTSKEVLARQAADHAPRPRPGPTKPAPSNSGTAATSKTNTPAQTHAFGLPAVPETKTAVQTYLDDHTSGSMISGTIAGFTKEGTFARKDTQEEISPETDWIARVPDTFITWVKFRKDEPPVYVGGLLFEGFVLPPRDTLGDLDQAEWALGLSGMPEDVWKNQIYLVLEHADTHEVITFVTGSKTGRNAVGSLLRHYERMRKTHPNDLPVVRLKVGGFNHKDERIGWVPTPVFVVCGRTPADSTTRPDTSTQAILDDDIPDFD
jgi:hypothetical protein